ncbi:MAG: hypothetical protein H0W94_01580 [Actinobacteria bacterium]|nr:hypothetical protein [Actinomycetota bacterium]
MQRRRFASTVIAAALLAGGLSGSAVASTPPWILEPDTRPVFGSPAGGLTDGQSVAPSFSWATMLSIALVDAFPEWSSARLGQVHPDRRSILAGQQDQMAFGLLGEQPTPGQVALELRMSHCWGTGVI